MTAALSPAPKLQFFDTAGNPLTGGKVYTYAAGTTTPLSTYVDSAGSTTNTNPIILDVRGEANIWLGSSAYKFVLKSADDTLIWTVDNITSTEYLRAYFTGLLTAYQADVANTTDATKGDALVGFRQSNAGGNLANAVGRTVHQKFQEMISVKDFGATGDGSTDDTTAIRNAVAVCSGKKLYFPSGTYLVSGIIDLVSNMSIVGDVKQSILKIKSGTYSSANASIFRAANVGNIYIYGIDFNGNKGNIGTTRNPINTIFNSYSVIYDTCRWISCEGVCLNISTDPQYCQILSCIFYQCGGATDNSDGYRNQAIAFSGSSSTNSLGTQIRGNYFYAQGLDCISMTNCNDIVISDNIAEDSYSFLYNNPVPYRSVNVTVTGNVIRNTNQGSLSNAVNPVAIDLPCVSNCTIVGNAIYKCAQSGIGIFEGSSNVVIDGNTLLDCGISPVSWVGGISVGGGLGSASNISEVVITDNTILSTGTLPLMKFGILIGNDVEALTISENNIVNAATSKYGYYLYTTVPTLANTYALTTNANTSSTTLINDFDAYAQAITNWRKVNTLTGYYFNGTKVVGAQQGAIANSGNATTDAILAALRAHGLIAT
jgi:hypothetical protein